MPVMKSLRVMLIGGGAREHALAWKLCSSSHVEHIFVVPGNGGTAGLTKATNHSEVAIGDYQGLVRLAQNLQIGLVVVGPDAAVVGGIEGYFKSCQ